MSKTPKPLSKGEEEFSLHCRFHNLPVEREFHFCERKWRVDFAFSAQKIAIEIEGGTWNHGRHSRGAGMAKDMEKYNRLALLGWRLLRYTPAMVSDATAINDVLKILGHADFWPR